MTKYRSRDIFEAVQWFPGKKVNGVTETKDGRAVVFLKGSIWSGAPNRLEWVNTGDYIAFHEGEPYWISSKEKFEKDYEDVGG